MAAVSGAPTTTVDHQMLLLAAVLTAQSLLTAECTAGADRRGARAPQLAMCARARSVLGSSVRDRCECSSGDMSTFTIAGSP